MATPYTPLFYSETYATTLTQSLTCHDVSNRILLVLTNIGASGATFNSIPLTDMGVLENQNKSQRLYALLDADFPSVAGTYDLVTSAPAQETLFEMLAIELYDAQQDTDFQFTTSWANTTSFYTQTVAYNSSAYLLDFESSSLMETLTPTSGQDELLASTVLNNRSWAIAGVAVSSQGMITSNWTQTAGTNLNSFRIVVRDVSESPFIPVHNTVQRGPVEDQSAAVVSSITPMLPNPPAAGNLLIAYVVVDKNSGAFGIPAGWNLGTYFYLENSASHAIFWREADGTTADESVELTWATAEQAIARMAEIDGFDNSVELLGANSAGTTSVVTSISTGSTVSVSSPAFAFALLSTDGQAQFDQYPALDNSFVCEPFHASANSTLGFRSAYAHIRSDGTIAATFSNNIQAGEQCSAGVIVFGDGEPAGSVAVGVSLVQLSVYSSAEASHSGHEGVVIDHTCTNAGDDEIPQEWIDAGCAQKILWNHQSVGNDILRGLEDLNALATAYALNLHSGSDYPEPTIAWYAANNGLGDFRRGDNGYPDQKIGFFDDIIRGNGEFDEFGSVVEVAFQKYCFLDVVSGSDVNAIWNAYISTLAALKVSYPGIIFPLFTVPLNTSGVAEKDAYNAIVRSYVSVTPDAILYDIADIESHEPDGTPVLDGGYQALYSGYTADSGHLNDALGVGQQRAARAMHWMFARIAGWDGSPPVASDSAINTFFLGTSF